MFCCRRPSPAPQHPALGGSVSQPDFPEVENKRDGRDMKKGDEEASMAGLLGLLRCHMKEVPGGHGLDMTLLISQLILLNTHSLVSQSKACRGLGIRQPWSQHSALPVCRLDILLNLFSPL